MLTAAERLINAMTWYSSSSVHFSLATKNSYFTLLIFNVLLMTIKWQDRLQSKKRKQKEKIYTTEPKVSAGPPPYLVKISNNESVLSDCASIQLVWIVALENGRLSSVYNVLNSNLKMSRKCFNVWLSTCLCMHGCLPACIHGCMHVCYAWMRTCLCIYGWVRVYECRVVYLSIHS